MSLNTHHTDELLALNNPNAALTTICLFVRLSVSRQEAGSCSCHGGQAAMMPLVAMEAVARAAAAAAAEVRSQLAGVR